MSDVSPRYINLGLGAWLFISAFLWRHYPQQLTNTWLCGALIVAFSFAEIRYAKVRYLTTTLSVWLFVSVFLLPANAAATFWNNLLVSIAVFFLSIAGTVPRTISDRPLDPL